MNSVIERPRLGGCARRRNNPFRLAKSIRHPEAKFNLNARNSAGRLILKVSLMTTVVIAEGDLTMAGILEDVLRGDAISSMSFRVRASLRRG
jgi:hypothetical protein